MRAVNASDCFWRMAGVIRIMSLCPRHFKLEGETGGLCLWGEPGFWRTRPFGLEEALTVVWTRPSSLKGHVLLVNSSTSKAQTGSQTVHRVQHVVKTQTRNPLTPRSHPLQSAPLPPRYLLSRGLETEVVRLGWLEFTVGERWGTPWISRPVWRTQKLNFQVLKWSHWNFLGLDTSGCVHSSMPVLSHVFSRESWLVKYMITRLVELRLGRDIYQHQHARRPRWWMHHPELIPIFIRWTCLGENAFPSCLRGVYPSTFGIPSPLVCQLISRISFIFILLKAKAFSQCPRS